MLLKQTLLNTQDNAGHALKVCIPDPTDVMHMCLSGAHHRQQALLECAISTAGSEAGHLHRHGFLQSQEEGQHLP